MSEIIRSESLGNLFTALAKAQGEIKGAKKDSENPFFKSSYADLDSVWEACRVPLSKNELAVIQIPFFGPEGLSVVTVLGHSSGEFIGGELGLNPKATDPQGIGSGITYGRRYALGAFAGVAPVDDDGEGAMNRDSRVQSPAKAPDGGIAVKCEDCQRPVIGYTGASGPVTMGQAIAQSKDRFEGKIFCGGCQIKHGRNAETKAKKEPKPEKKLDSVPGEVPLADPEIVQDEDGNYWAQGTVTQVFHGGKAFSFKMGQTMFTCWHKSLVPLFVSALNKKVEFCFKVSADQKFRNVERITMIDGKSAESQLDPSYITEQDTVNA